MLVDVEVDPRCDGTYLFARATSAGADGLFVRTLAPEPPGTAVRLRIVDDADETLALEGVVAWCNRPRPGAIDPGMGVQFVDARVHDRQRLTTLIGRIAYLDEVADRHRQG